MQIVIDIPEEVYRAYKMDSSLNLLNTDQKSIAESYLINGLINGTPLPKEHGRLIDADELTKEIKGYISDTSNLHYNDLEEAEAFNSAYYNCLDEIEDASTIMEADRSEVLNVKIAVEDK